MSGDALPLVRAVVLDARAKGARLALEATTATARVRFVRIASTTRTTRTMVDVARGTDALVIIAGPRVAAVARDARIVRAAGVRAGVIALDAGASDDDERKARHLLTGIGLAGDDALSIDVADDVAAVVARAAPPIARDGFLVVARAYGVTQVRGRVLEGPVGKEGFVLGREGFAPVDAIRVVRGDDDDMILEIGTHGFARDDDVVLSSAALPQAARFAADDPTTNEPCVAFGGNGGWASGTIDAGVLALDRPICPRDGRAGVVLFQGAGLGPVRVVNVRAS